MGRKVLRVGRLHLAEAPDGDRHVSVGRGAELIVELDIRNLAVELVLASWHGRPAAARRDLKVKPAEEVAVLARGSALEKEGGRLQLARCGGQPGYRRAWHTDDEIRAQMPDEVLAD